MSKDKKLNDWINWIIKYVNWLEEYRLTKEIREAPEYMNHAELLIHNDKVWCDTHYGADEKKLWGVIAKVSQYEIDKGYSYMTAYEREVIDRINKIK